MKTMDILLDEAEERAYRQCLEMAEKSAQRYADEKQRMSMLNAMKSLMQSGVRIMRLETENLLGEVMTKNNTKPQC